MFGLGSNELKLFMMDTNVDDGFMNGIQVRIWFLKQSGYKCKGWIQMS